MEVSHKVRLAQSKPAACSADFGRERCCKLGKTQRAAISTKLSSGAHLLYQVLFRNWHKIASLLQNRQHLSRIHFLNNNSFPEQSVTLCKVSPSSPLSVSFADWFCSGRGPCIATSPTLAFSRLAAKVMLKHTFMQTEG